MSKFSTTIPVNIKGVIDLLPKSAYVHSIALKPDHTGIIVEWDTQTIHTGFTFPVEYPLDKLKPVIVTDSENEKTLTKKIDKRFKANKVAPLDT